MSFIHVTRDALSVPGKMDLDELAFLAALSALVPDGGRIVEVGPFYGRSTRAMARANPKARITSIDTFEDVEWTSRYAGEFGDIPAFGRAAFDHFTRGLANVEAIEGFSPDVVADWSDPIDMYFEDAIHGNPGLKRNLDFWTRRLKPGGIACGHDYTLRFPDIKTEVDAIARSWGTRVRVVGSLWALRKPDGSGATADTIGGLMPTLVPHPRLTLRVANRKRGPDLAHDGYWCGAHMEVDRLNWLLIDEMEPASGLRLEYRIGHRTHGTTDWIPAGRKARLDVAGVPRPFTRIAVRISGDAHDRIPHVIYRVSARQISRGGSRLSGTSAWAADGAWAELRTAGPAINAVTVSLADDLPPEPQSSFTRKRSALWEDIGNAIRRKVLAR